MINALAKLKYARISPKKLRLVANMIKGMPAKRAQAVLSVTNKKGARILLKLLNSAIANANYKGQFDQDKLYIKSITVDKGPFWKRIMPRARGRADRINKPTSHVCIVLSDY